MNLKAKPSFAASFEVRPLICPAIRHKEFHVDLTKDGKSVIFYPCCAGWVHQEEVPSIATEELLKNYTADTLFDLLQQKYEETLLAFEAGLLCKSPLVCNKELQLLKQAPGESFSKLGWLIASTSRACNLRCVMCDIATHSTTPDQVKLTRMMHDCIKGRELENFTPTMVGEPFAMDFFMDWCLNLTKKDTKALYLLTNASLLTVEDIDKLYKTLKANGVWVTFSVSIDSVHKECYESIRRGADFDRVIANTQHMAKLGILQSINYVVIPGVNEDELEYAGKAFQDMGLPEPELLFDSRCPPGLSSFKVSTLKAALSYKVFYNRPKEEIEPEIARRENEACNTDNRPESE